MQYSVPNIGKFSHLYAQWFQIHKKFLFNPWLITAFFFIRSKSFSCEIFDSEKYLVQIGFRLTARISVKVAALIAICNLNLHYY